MDNSPEITALLGMAGLVRRAGKLTPGFDAVFKDIGTGRARIVLLSEDASPRTAQKIIEVCRDAQVDCARISVSKETLGHAVGRNETAVLAVSDDKMAQKIFGLAQKCGQILRG